MASPFELLVTNLEQLGFFGFLLPWLLVFAVVYALLLKSKLLGDDHKIIGVVSLVVAFFVIGFGGLAFGRFFSNLFGMASLVFAGILVTVLFAALAGIDISKFADKKAIMVLAAGIGIIVFVTALGGLGAKINSEVFAAIFMVIVMGVAIMFITGTK